MRILPGLKRISGGRTSRYARRVTTPSSIHASPSAQGLARLSLAVSKSIAIARKARPCPNQRILGEIGSSRERASLATHSRAGFGRRVVSGSAVQYATAPLRRGGSVAGLLGAGDHDLVTAARERDR